MSCAAQLCLRDPSESASAGVLRSQIKNLSGDIGVSKAWLKCYEPLDRALLDDAIGVLADSGIESSDGSHPESGLGLVLLGDLSTELIDWLERASRRIPYWR